MGNHFTGSVDWVDYRRAFAWIVGGFMSLLVIS